jgi:transcriptional regulator with XRE-family HTH domain
MTLTFGARLRLQREEQQVTLTEIAAETKISVSLLEGLERDDVSRWPKGLFRRAYIRAYAQAIGLDPDPVVMEFVALYPDPTDVLHTGITIWPDAEGSEGESEPARALRRFVTALTGAMPGFLQGTSILSNGDAPAGGDDVMRQRTASRSDQQAAAEPAAMGEPPRNAGRPREITLAEAAKLCAGLAQVQELDEAEALLGDAVRYLDAVGLIVWMWDGASRTLQPRLAYGYSASVLARIPKVSSDAENAVAAAFRGGNLCVVAGAGDLTGAVVVPIMTATGPAGAVALEFRPGSEQHESMHALITILAAQLGPMLEPSRFAKSKTA